MIPKAIRNIPTWRTSSSKMSYKKVKENNTKRKGTLKIIMSFGGQQKP
jgi:hypothetical protein